MPKELEERLEKQARKKHMKGKGKNAYVYGTLRRSGWRPGREMDNSSRGSTPFNESEIEQGFRRMG